MKLRNKQTGEIIELLAKPSFVKRNEDFLQSEVNTFNSLADLNAEWEDYEEPKEYWFIGYDAQVECISEKDSDGIELDKAIGNYFETEEEAKKAVEKLKAFKRLKDKGFKFTDFNFHRLDKQATLNIYAEVKNECIYEDLLILFGGEE